MWEGIEEATQQYIDKSINDDLCRINEVYLSRTDSPKGNFWVAYREGSSELLGMVGLQYISNEEAELRRMSVSRSARREGVGSLLLNELLKFATEQGYQKCILSTLTRMEPGRRLYEKFGFTTTKTEQVAPEVFVIYYEKSLVE